MNEVEELLTLSMRGSIDPSAVMMMMLLLHVVSDVHVVVFHTEKNENWKSHSFIDPTTTTTMTQFCKLFFSASTYGNHLREKILNRLEASRQRRIISQDFKANSTRMRMQLAEKVEVEVAACICQFHLKSVPLKLLALLLPCFMAAWCSPPLMTCTSILEASKLDKNHKREEISCHIKA